MIDLSDITNSQIEHVIDEYIHSERDRLIMKRRLIDGICYEPLAWEFNLSTVSIKKIVYKCEKIIFRHLRSRRQRCRLFQL